MALGISAEQRTTTPQENDWIAAARRALIKGGVGAVQINALAKQLNVTRGGFYWRFRNRKDLLDQLILGWEKSNTRSFLRALEQGGSPSDRYRRLMRVIEKKVFDPGLEAAVRQWATQDPEVAAKLRQADLDRISALEGLFADAGQSADEAFIRARIVYYHQVGFNVVGLNEAPQGRPDLTASYHRMLCGF